MARLSPLGITIVAALAMLGLPFWGAMAVLLVWLVWAMSEVVRWTLTLRTERRRHDVRNLIERELAAVPVTTPIPAQFPRAWRPFIGERRPLSASRHAGR